MRHRVGFVLVAFLLAASVLALPFVVVSMIGDLRTSTELIDLTPPGVEAADSYTYVRLDVLSIDDVNGIADLRVSGNHICSGCGRRERITFYSISNTEGGPQANGVPPAVAVTLPATADTLTQSVQLPIHGNLIAYPFDRHRLWLGVTMERLNANGSVETLSPTEAHSHLVLQLRNGAARMDMAAPRPLSAESVQPGRARVPYADVFALEFNRPAYLQFIVPVTIALVTAAAFYAVALRPFNELIINSGALVLGVWGIRSLLLGSYPPNTTTVDGVLTLLIVLVLIVISARALRHMHDQAGLKLLPGSRKV